MTKVTASKERSAAMEYSEDPQSATYNLQQITISNFAAFSKITIRHEIS